MLKSIRENEPGIEKKVRVQLDFDQKDMTIINDLVADLELGTRAELFRSGLRVLRWMAQKKANGCTVVAITPEDRYIEPDFEFFHHIKSLRSPAPDTTGTPNAAPQTAAGEAVNRV